MYKSEKILLFVWILVLFLYFQTINGAEVYIPSWNETVSLPNSQFYGLETPYKVNKLLPYKSGGVSFTVNSNIENVRILTFPEMGIFSQREALLLPFGSVKQHTTFLFRRQFKSRMNSITVVNQNTGLEEEITYTSFHRPKVCMTASSSPNHLLKKTDLQLKQRQYNTQSSMQELLLWQLS